MQYIEAKVTIDRDDHDLAEELVVSIFDDLQLSGVVIQNGDQNSAALPADALPVTNAVVKSRVVIGYFSDDSSGRRRCQHLESALADLKHRQGIDTGVAYGLIDEEDWAHSWKTHFHPQKVGDRIVIKPIWHDYQAGCDDLVIEVDPGMAFDTGTHPTTVLCVQMIEKYLLPGQKQLDVGTGTGILLIAGAKLGAGSGVGIDHDFVAVSVAAANFAINRLNPTRFFLLQGSLCQPINGRFDLITANILVGPILDLIGTLKHHLHPQGVFICAGILKSQVEKITDQLAAQGFEPIESTSQQDWICLAARPLPQLPPAPIQE